MKRRFWEMEVKYTLASPCHTAIQVAEEKKVRFSKALVVDKLINQ